MVPFASLDKGARQQFVMVAIPPIVLIFLFSGLLFYWQWQEKQLLAESAAERDLVAIHERLTTALAIPLRDLSGIAHAPLISKGLDESDPVARRDDIANALYPLVYQNPAYFQVRWIRSSGIEGVRIDSDRVNKRVVRIPPQALQDKSHRDYHQKIMARKPFDLYLSEPGLNREYGRIEYPLRPTIRVAIRLPPTRNKDHGYLIINVALNQVLQPGDLSASTEMELFVASPGGDWVIHPEPGHTWASELGNQYTVKTEAPELWQRLRQNHSGTSIRGDGNWYLKAVTLPRRYVERLGNATNPMLYLMLKEPGWIANKRLTDSLMLAISVGLLLATGTLFFLWLYYRRLKHAVELRRVQEEQASALHTKNREIEQLNAELAERSQRAENTARTKSAFLANMSHEIRTPMNAILGLLDMLESSDLNARQHNQIAKIQGAARSLLQILNDILDLSKMEAGKYRVVEDRFSIENLIRQCAQLFQPGFDSKGLELLAWVDPELPVQACGDGPRLTQVLNNLLGNALKFTEQGSVTLSATLEAREGDNVQVAFSVTDTGSGIPAEKLTTLFDAFEQADTSTTRQHGGTGLGLAICKALVEAMGGQIRVASKPGQGSTFSFSLSFTALTQNIPDHRQLAIQRALIVESHSNSAELLAAYLKAWGIESSLAVNAEDAVSAYRQSANEKSRFGAIVVNWQLPEKDGIWLLETLQDDLEDQHPEATVLITTMTDQEALERRLRESSAIRRPPTILSKPVTPSALFESLFGRDDLFREGQAEAAVAQTFEGARILVVEDNELNQEVALGYLQRLGIQADLATDGYAALAQAAETTYDLILMDLHMPGMDGLETTRKLRESYSSRTLPIVAMTAAAFEEDARQALSAGMNDHLAKPITVRRLASILARWLDAGIAESASTPVAPSAAEECLPDELRTDPILAGKVLRSFLKQYGKGARHQVPDDAAQRRLWLHTLKGAAGTIGLNELGQLAENAEIAHSPVEQARLVSALEGKLQDDLKRINTWLEELQSEPDDASLQTLEALLHALEQRLQHSLVPTRKQRAELERLSETLSVGPQIQELIKCLDNFDFPKARSAIAAICEQLEFDDSCPFGRSVNQ